MSKTRILKWKELGMGECKSACADVSQMCHFHRKQAWGSLYCRCLVYSWILRSLTVRCHMSGIYSIWSANYFVGVLKYFCISYRLIEKKFVIVTNNEWHNSFLIGCVHNRCSSFLLPNLACITMFNTKLLSIADLNLKIVSSQVMSFIRSSVHVCSFHFHIWKQRLSWKRGSWVNEQ